MLLSLIQTNPLIFVFLAVAILLAVAFHEFAHAWIAHLLGDPTPKQNGRVTLNPLAHLDPIGTFTLFVAGFGWGKPVRYDPYYVKWGKVGETLIALAGPASNVLMAFVFALPYRIGLLQGASMLGNPWFAFVSVVVEINLLLAAFNLIPIPPLDGSKLLYLALDWITGGKFDVSILENIGPVLLLALIFAHIAMDSNILLDLLNPLITIFRWIVGGVGIPIV